MTRWVPLVEQELTHPEHMGTHSLWGFDQSLILRRVFMAHFLSFRLFSTLISIGHYMVSSLSILRLLIIALQTFLKDTVGWHLKCYLPYVVMK